MSATDAKWKSLLKANKSTPLCHSSLATVPRKVFGDITNNIAAQSRHAMKKNTNESIANIDSASAIQKTMFTSIAVRINFVKKESTVRQSQIPVPYIFGGGRQSSRDWVNQAVSNGSSTSKPLKERNHQGMYKNRVVDKQKVVDVGSGQTKKIRGVRLNRRFDLHMQFRETETMKRDDKLDNLY